MFAAGKVRYEIGARVRTEHHAIHAVDDYGASGTDPRREGVKSLRQCDLRESAYALGSASPAFLAVFGGFQESHGP